MPLQYRLHSHELGPVAPSVGGRGACLAVFLEGHHPPPCREWETETDLSPPLSAPSPPPGSLFSAYFPG